MPALVAGIHVFGPARKAWMAPQLGLPELLIFEVPQVG
jgi:hypothetical protein